MSRIGREYEAGLRNRGSLTVWLGLCDGKLANWDAKRTASCQGGRPRKYSNHAIETAVTLSIVFHLPSRQTEGFMRSLFDLLNLANDVPDHTTICRRKAKLGKSPLAGQQGTKPVHILIDSSGLKVHVGQLRSPPKNREDRSPRVLIPPQKGAQLAPQPVTARERNRSIRSQARLGKQSWLALSGYGKRAKVETTFSRYKQIFGPAMRARRLVSQRVEARIACKILNQMTALGMPDGQMIG